MKIEFDSATLKLSTKRVAALLAMGGAVVQVPAVKDALLKMIEAHPHWATVIPTAVTLWTLVHNPQVEQILGLDGETPDPK